MLNNFVGGASSLVPWSSLGPSWSLCCFLLRRLAILGGGWCNAMFWRSGLGWYFIANCNLGYAISIGIIKSLMYMFVSIVAFLVYQGALVMSRSILFCSLCILKILGSGAEPQMVNPYCHIGLSNIMYVSILLYDVIIECLCSMCFNMYNRGIVTWSFIRIGKVI